MDEMLDSHQVGGYPHIPPYLHIFQHVWRSSNFTQYGHYVKCLHNTDSIELLHNHYPMWCLGEGGGCAIMPVDTSEGQLNHYRRDCVNTLQKTCKELYKDHSELDDKVWRYKKPVMDRITKVLQKLNLI